MRHIALASILLAVTASSAGAQPAPAPSPAPPVPEEPPEKVVARALLREGKRLADAGRKREALGLFEKAYQTYPATPILINIGLARKDLGDFVEAARVFQRFLDDPARDLGLVPVAEGALVDLDKVLTRVTLDIQTTDAVPIAITLDAGTWDVPPVSRVMRVAPGAHRIEARGGGVTFVASAGLDAVAGVPLLVTLRLIADPPAPPVVDEPPPPPPVEDLPPIVETPVAPTIAVVVIAPPRPPSRFGAFAHLIAQQEFGGATGAIGATFTPRDRLTLALGGMAGGNYAGFATATYAVLPGRLRPTVTLGAIASRHEPAGQEPGEQMIFGVAGEAGMYYGVHGAIGAEWMAGRRLSVIADAAFDYYPSGSPYVRALSITPTVGVHVRI